MFEIIYKIYLTIRGKMFFKNLKNGLFSRSDCDNGFGRDKIIQNANGICNKNTINNTINNYTNENSNITLKALELQKKLMENFSPKSAKWFVTEIKNSIFNSQQPDAGCIKSVTRVFDNMQFSMKPSDQAVFYNLKKRALSVLHKFIETKNDVNFVNDWIEIGNELTNLFDNINRT